MVFIHLAPVLGVDITVHKQLVSGIEK